MDAPKAFILDMDFNIDDLFVAPNKPKLPEIDGMPIFGYNKVTRKEFLGQGSCGVCFSAEYQGMVVAIKELLKKGCRETYNIL